MALISTTLYKGRAQHLTVLCAGLLVLAFALNAFAQNTATPAAGFQAEPAAETPQAASEAAVAAPVPPTASAANDAVTPPSVPAETASETPVAPAIPAISAAPAVPVTPAAPVPATPPAAEPKATGSRVIVVEAGPDANRSELVRKLFKALDQDAETRQTAEDQADQSNGYSARMSLHPSLPYDRAEKLVETLKQLSITRMTIGTNTDSGSSVVVQCPADATWRQVHTIIETLEALGAFNVDVRVSQHTVPDTSPRSPAVKFQPDVSYFPPGAAGPPAKQASVDQQIAAEPAPDARGIGSSRSAASRGALPPAAIDLAVPAADVSRRVFSFHVGFADRNPNDLTQQFEQLEQQAQQLASQARESHASPAEAQRLKIELQQVVRRAFETRQQIQRTELAQFATRLRDLQQSIDNRDRISRQIIDRRVNDLLDPDLQWNTPATNSPLAQPVSQTPSTRQPATSPDSPTASDIIPPDATSHTTESPADDRLPTDLILGRSPEDLHELLARLAESMRQLQAHAQRYETQIAQGQDVEDAQASLVTIHRQLDEYSRKQNLAWQQYRQQIAVLRAAVNRDKIRLAQAENSCREIEALIEKGSLPADVQQEYNLQKETASLALTRSQALHDIYQQVGEGLAPQRN